MTNLDRTWKNCLRMWKWISENLPDGLQALDDCEKDTAITKLKRQWLADHGFVTHLFEDCFFCEYDEEEKSGCCSCPGKLVDPNFGCSENEGDYDWSTHPKAFYRKLLELDKKRRQK